MKFLASAWSHLPAATNSIEKAKNNMTTHQLAMLSQVQRQTDRKIFRRRAILTLGNNQTSHARTIDISPQDLNIMVDAPLEIGHAASLAFNVTIKQKTTPLEFKGRVSYCVLVGREGFRVGFALAAGDALHKKHIAHIMRESL